MHNAVVNSTPLIALAKCDALEVLHAMYDEVLIPEAVYKEICAVDDIVSKSLKSSLDWIHVKKIEHVSDKKYYRTRLHDGEVEVMILSQEVHPDVVVIDDLAARSTAEYYNLPITGTLGLLIKAKRKGIIDAVMPLVNKMQENHIYYSDKLIEMVRKRVGE